MKKMTCKQLGGACEKVFHANSFEEMEALSKQHGMEMFQKGDESHLKAMRDIKALMTSAEAIQKWMEGRKKEFENLPEV